MADWRTLARAALLADNQIDDRKVAILRKELLGDKRVERSELEFLFEAQKAAHTTCPAFTKLVYEAVRVSILGDGKVTAENAAWLRNWVLADGKVNDAEKHLLKELKLLADQTSPEFEALYAQYAGQ